MKKQFTILDVIWTKYGQLIAEKSCQILSHSLALPIFTIMLLLLGLKNGCLELLGCEWINFLSQNNRMHRNAGTTS